MKNIIFIAPPAAGKGTQANLLANKYNIPHISTGDLLRDEATKSTDLGIKIKETLSEGLFVNDEIITRLLKKRILESDCNNGYILDGYPRNLEQAKIYEKLLESINKDLGIVVFLDIDKKLAMKRALSRIECSNCDATYNFNIDSLKPKRDDVCDKCGGVLSIREDDTKETFITRFETYVKKTQSLIDYYKSKNVLEVVRITENLSALDIFNQIEEIISKYD